MAENRDLYTTAEAWADIVIKNWHERMARLNIGRTNTLANSFAIHIQREANGNPKLIEFAFEYYGKFVDMGAVGGLRAGEGKAKPWYSKEFFSQTRRLAVIMKEKYEREAVLTIVENIDNGNN